MSPPPSVFGPRRKAQRERGREKKSEGRREGGVREESEGKEGGREVGRGNEGEGRSPQLFPNLQNLQKTEAGAQHAKPVS